MRIVFKRIKWSFLVLVSGMLLLVAGVEPAQAVFAGQNGRMAFDRDNGPGHDSSRIYTMNPNVSGRKAVTAVGTSSPMFSPDGTKIVYEGSKEYDDGGIIRSQGDIYVMNANGSGKRNLTKSPTVDEAFPVLPPDGSKIAFVQWTYSGEEGERAQLYIMDADGSNKKSLSSEP